MGVWMNASRMNASQMNARMPRRTPMRLALLTLSAMALLGACNTVEGFGRDLGALGDALTGASQDARSGHSSTEELEGGPGSRRN